MPELNAMQRQDLIKRAISELKLVQPWYSASICEDGSVLFHLLGSDTPLRWSPPKQPKKKGQAK